MVNILNIVITAFLVLLAITVHEFSHGLVSYWLGDPTPKEDGRLSFNPIHHVDIVGAICLLVFGFGWAKPVMVNPQYYKNPKLGMALTALGGPLSNFIMAFISVVLLKVFENSNSQILIYSLETFMSINLGLGVFNLIPIPPLDGFKIFGALLPNDAYFAIMRFERYGFIILVMALWLGLLNNMLSFGVYSIQHFFYNIVGLI